MELLSLLTDDHREAQGLIGQIEMTSARGIKSRERLFEKLNTLLMAHMKAEEDVFYRCFKSDDEHKDIYFEGMDEHRIARMLLKELTKMNSSDEAWKPKFRVFKDVIEHHINEEEHEFFDTARELFSSDDLNELGDAFAERKQALMPMPERRTGRAKRAA